MQFARLAALIFAVQGVLPALLLGILRPYGWFLMLIAVVYAFMVWGLWHAQRWAWWLALSLTALQVLGISSWSVSWQFVVGIDLGVVFVPEWAPWDIPFSFFRTVGDRVDYAFFSPCSSLLATFTDFDSGWFLTINFVAAGLLAMLLGIRPEFVRRPPMPNHALQRTEAGHGVASDHDA